MAIEVYRKEKPMSEVKSSPATEKEKWIASLNMQILKATWTHYANNLKSQKYGKNFYKTVYSTTNEVGAISNGLAVLKIEKAKKVEALTGLNREIFTGKKLMTLSVVGNENLDISKMKYYLAKNSEASNEKDRLIQKAINNIHIDIGNDTDLYKWCYYLCTGNAYSVLSVGKDRVLTEEELKTRINDVVKMIKKFTKHDWLHLDTEDLSNAREILENQLHIVSIVEEFKKIQ